MNGSGLRLPESYGDKALLEPDALLGMVLDQLPVVLFATDRDGVIRLARGRGAVRLGPGAVGRNAFELFRDVPHVAENLRRALAGEEVTSEGMSDKVWWETRYMPLRSPDARIVGVVGVTMDATARKRAEEELKKVNARLTELDELKARFVANVSHELRTPLALVLGLTERMRRTEGEGGRHAADLASVDHHARLLLKHVNDLLDVAKLDAGRVQPDYAEVDLARLVAVAAASFEMVAAERSIELTVERPQELVAQVDPDQVERILLNLLSNAFKLTPRDGRVRLALSRTGDQATLLVGDSGPGVPPSRRQAIFERFVRLERGDEARFGGTGLGLSIVRDFVTLHGGTVTVDDDPMGGARFAVTLPVHAPAGVEVRPRVAPVTTLPIVQPARAADAPQPLPSTGRPLVLVVEDNPAMRRFVSETLGDAYQVLSAEDGEGGLARARESRPAAIVTDLSMPRMDGEQLLRAIRADSALADTPVLVLTAMADDAARVRLLRQGAQDYLLKPFGAEELLARVGNAVTLRRAQVLLAHELRSTSRNVAELAEQLVEQRRNLRHALDSMNAAREDAANAGDVKSALLDVLSSEVHAPLDELRRDAEELAGDQGLAGEARKRADGLRRRAAGLVETLEEVLRQADLQGTRLSVRIDDVDVGTLVRDLAADLAGRAAHTGAVLRPRVAEGRIPARTDARLLRILLTNLVNEALARVDARGTVALEASSGPSGPTIEIAWRSAESGRHDGPTLGSAIVHHVAGALGARVARTRATRGGDGTGAGDQEIATVTLPAPTG